MTEFRERGQIPQGLKPSVYGDRSGTAEEAAEKVKLRRPAPKGAIDFEGLVVSLNRYPDTRPEFPRSV